MKSIFVLCFFISFTYFGYAQYTQIPTGRFSGFPYGQSQDSGLNPSICDTLKYIFRQFTDSFYIKKDTGNTSGYTSKDTITTSKIYSVDRLDSLNDNITGSPFVYIIQYQSGNDSVWMFNVFRNVIEKVKECLLGGIVKEADGHLSHDPEYSRNLRYEYVIKTLKDGMDPKLRNSIISIQFYPDTRGIVSDKFVLYRVNLVIHP